MRLRYYLSVQILLLLLTVPAFSAEFLLSFFCQPPQLSLSRFQEIKDANFNVAMFDGGSTTANQAALTLCQQVGIKGMVMDSRMYNLQYHPGHPQFSWYMNTIINSYKWYPAFWGYYVADEPGASTFDILGGVVDYLTSRDPAHTAYINLFPTYASPEQLGTATYEQYVDQYISKVKPKLLSFDHYALCNDNNERIDYFQNLEIIRRKGIGANIPFAFVFLATGHMGYRDPNENEINWQVNTALAYGAKGLLYYTYGAYDSGYPNSCIDINGNKTAKYYIAQRVNAGVLKLAPTLMKLKSTAVYHTSPVPTGAVGIKPSCVVKSISGGQMVVGEFVTDAGERYAMFVNRDMRNSANFSITLRGILSLFSVSRTTGLEEPISPTYGPATTVWQSSFSPGEGKLVRMTGPPIANPSFEVDWVHPGWSIEGWNVAPTGWTAEGSDVYKFLLSTADGNRPHGVGTATDGVNVFCVQCGTIRTGIYQTAFATLKPDSQYTLSVDVYAGDWGANGQYAGNEVKLMAGNTIYLDSYNPMWGQGYTQIGDLINGTPAGYQWNLGNDSTIAKWYTVAQRFITGPAGSNPDFGQPLTIYIRRGDNGGAGWTAFDNVVLDIRDAVVCNVNALKSLKDSLHIVAAGTVTASFSGYFYIESADRTSGIRVIKDGHNANPGLYARVYGFMGTLSSGERYVDASDIVLSAGSSVATLGMTNKSVGGGQFGNQAGVTGARGLNNIGLLVRITGKVVETGAGWIKINDGSGVGLKVIDPNGVGLPASGYVILSGISSCEKNGSDISRVVILTGTSPL